MYGARLGSVLRESGYRLHCITMSRVSIRIFYVTTEPFGGYSKNLLAEDLMQ